MSFRISRFTMLKISSFARRGWRQREAWLKIFIYADDLRRFADLPRGAISGSINGRTLRLYLPPCRLFTATGLSQRQLFYDTMPMMTCYSF